jgi:Domain of unknown function (DUF4424)
LNRWRRDTGLPPRSDRHSSSRDKVPRNIENPSMQRFTWSKCWGPLALIMAGAGALPAAANDSSAELTVGGLVFTKSAEVSMESEDLTITPELVTVRYRFLNQSPKPVTLTVAFPLPDIDLSEADNVAIPASDPTNFVGFETKVDGKPITFTVNQRAVLGDKDVSALLRGLGVPLLALGAQHDKLAELPPAARDKLVDEGLLIPVGQTEQGKPIYGAGWKVKTSAVRQQTFAPNTTVLVEHRYKTSLGVSFDTVMRRALRANRGIEKEVERYRKDYCVTDKFLADLDKLAGTAAANTAKVQERRISYVLKTGANWAGPIKQFRLLVDSRNAGRLVSFCGPNLKTISPTTTEATAKDFTPDRDLKILIVGRF